MRSLKSLLGSGMLALLLIGSLILFGAFRRKGTLSAAQLDRLIQEELLKAGYDQAMCRYWAAISRHETANYTSRLAVEQNNLFGMRQPSVRPTTSKGEQNGYASFSSPTDSVRDLVMYLNARNYPKRIDTVDSLVSFMKDKGYYEDTYANYLRGVKAALTRMTGSFHGSGGSWDEMPSNTLNV